jgi:carbon storage regulator
MLVMKRRQGEAILIGDEIEIQLAHIGRNKVKIAIRAPRDIRVIAKEIQNVRDENQAAASTDLAQVISQMEPIQQRYQRAVRTLGDLIGRDTEPKTESAKLECL